jgi:hypothetical protein
LLLVVDLVGDFYPLHAFIRPDVDLTGFNSGGVSTRAARSSMSVSYFTVMEAIRRARASNLSSEKFAQTDRNRRLTSSR